VLKILSLLERPLNSTENKYHFPPHLNYVATLPWEGNSLQITKDTVAVQWHAQTSSTSAAVCERRLQQIHISFWSILLRASSWSSHIYVTTI